MPCKRRLTHFLSSNINLLCAGFSNYATKAYENTKTMCCERPGNYGIEIVTCRNFKQQRNSFKSTQVQLHASIAENIKTIELKEVKVKVKLRFSAPSAGIAEIEQT